MFFTLTGWITPAVLERELNFFAQNAFADFLYISSTQAFCSSFLDSSCLLPPKLLQVLLLFLEKTGPTVPDSHVHKTSWEMRDGFGAGIIPVVQKIHAEAFN